MGLCPLYDHIKQFPMEAAIFQSGIPGGGGKTKVHTQHGWCRDRKTKIAYRNYRLVRNHHGDIADYTLFCLGGFHMWSLQKKMEWVKNTPNLRTMIHNICILRGGMGAIKGHGRHKWKPLPHERRRQSKQNLFYRLKRRRGWATLLRPGAL